MSKIRIIPLDGLPSVLRDMSDHATHKDRPFTGQSHTHQGERGKTEVKGIRFRDLADCVCRAFVHSAAPIFPDTGHELGSELRRRAEDGTLNYNDLYDLDLSRMSPEALIQNIVCEVEKAMGIYPNVPELPEPDTTP